MASRIDWAYVREVGFRIRQAREAQGLTQMDLAIKADIPRNQLGRVERGEINTSIGTLKRIADALGVEVKGLV